MQIHHHVVTHIAKIRKKEVVFRYCTKFSPEEKLARLRKTVPPKWLYFEPAGQGKEKETIYRVRAPAGQSQTPAQSQAPVPANPQHPPRRGWWHQETPGQPPPEPSDLSFKDGGRQGVLNPSRTHCCPRGARYWTWQFLPGEAPSAPRRAQGPLWGSWQPSCSRGRLSRHGPHGRAEW